MSQISAAAVKELRNRTGAGMMDCKKALTENQGDVEVAVDWLRTKGLAAAAKKAGRTAAEGLVGVAIEGNKGAIIEVNAETDFIARNESFQEFVTNSVKEALRQGKKQDIQSFGAIAYPGSGRTMEDELKNLISVIGENMNIRRVDFLEVSQGVVTAYTHGAVQPSLGRMGVLVALESTGDKTTLEALGKQIAMHIAAAMPLSTSVEDLDKEVVERERKIFAEQARESGKKEEFIDKMIEGRLRKFYEETVLSEQVFLIDETKRRVSQVVSDMAKSLNTSIVLKGFVCFKLGAGIEREEKDFAAEVAQQLTK